MELKELLDHLDRGQDLVGGTDPNNTMNFYSSKCIKLCAELNSGYHTPEEIRSIMSRITGVPIDEGFRLFPPFYSDFGKNIRFGKNVFVNALCCFQDQGGIRIGDNALIGHRVTFATLNHDIDPEKRHILHCARGQECLDRCRCHHIARRDHWRRCNSGSRGPGQQRRTPENHCRRHACQSAQDHRLTEFQTRRKKRRG